MAWPRWKQGPSSLPWAHGTYIHLVRESHEDWSNPRRLLCGQICNDDQSWSEREAVVGGWGRGMYGGSSRRGSGVWSSLFVMKLRVGEDTIYSLVFHTPPERKGNCCGLGDGSV